SSPGHPPRQHARPGLQGVNRPFVRLLLVTRRTRIRHAVPFRHDRRDELERVAADVDVRNRLLNGRHVARDALAALTGGGMLGVEFERAARARLPCWIVALQTDGVPGHTQIRLVVGPVDVMAGGALDALQVHLALHVVVALHAVLVRRAFRPMREARRAQMVFFELPHVGQPSAGLVTDGPVVVAALNGIGPRLSLRVALDTDIDGPNDVERAWVDDRVGVLVADMLTARAMASLTTDVPLRHGSGLDVVVHRMTAVAQ